MESGDWRAHLQEGMRQRIQNKIIEASERYLPTTGHKGLQELKKIAVQFEEKVYTAATSQSDYLRKISLEMQTLERSQNSVPDLVQANNVLNPLDPDMTGVARAGYRYGFCGGNIVYEGKGTQPWTEEEDKMLVDALMGLHVSRKFVNADINSDYVKAVHQLMDPDKRHPDNFYSLNSIRYRMVGIYTEFDIVQKMLDGTHMSGFSWDPEKLCVIADDQVWAKYLKFHPCAAKFRTKPFPLYNKLHTIFVEDTTKVKVEDVVPENQIIPCLEGKEVHGSGNASSFNRDKEIVSSKRKRTEGNDLNGNRVESKVLNQGINAANDIMGKVASQIKDLPRLKLDERLLAMSVIGRSEPLSVMFDQLDEGGKVRMAQMVAVGAIN